MHFERDALKSKLTPLLSQLLFPYGESVDLIDLRWGVDTSQLEDEESNKKVLKVCLDEIDEAKPYIIVLIGERYGWIPPEALLNETANTKGLHINETDMSITNLEIEYAAFFNEEPNDKILFYFRDEMDDSEMDEFEKIVYKSESPIHKYRRREISKSN